jgi:putative tricarboxylic transport membrane protein
LLVVAVVLVVSSLYLMIKPDADAKWPVGKSALELVISVVVLVVYARLPEPLGFIISTTVALTPYNLRRLSVPPMYLLTIVTMVAFVGIYSIWSSPLAIGLWLVAGLGLVLPTLVGPILRRRMRSAVKEDPVSD